MCRVVCILVAFGWLLPQTAQAHDLHAPDGTPIEHDHVCVPRIVAVTGTAGVKDLAFTHRKEMTEDEKADALAMGPTFTARFAPDVKLTSPPTNGQNCHGLTFDPRDPCWIDNGQVDAFIKGCVPTVTARPGDIVIYRDLAGHITHSGRVTRVDGGRVWVHSKWGRGPDFDHPIDQVPQGQGYDYEFPAGTTRHVTRGAYGSPTIYHCP